MYIYYLFHCYLGRFGTIKPVYPPPLVIQYLARSVSVMILLLSTVLLLDFRVVQQTVWQFLFFSIRFQNCSDSVVVFAFLLDFRTVQTVWQFLFFYQTLELFRQCGSFCFFIRLQNCSDSMVVFALLLDFRTVSTVWQFLLFYQTLELFRQCGSFCFVI